MIRPVRLRIPRIVTVVYSGAGISEISDEEAWEAWRNGSYDELVSEAAGEIDPVDLEYESEIVDVEWEEVVYQVCDECNEQADTCECDDDEPDEPDEPTTMWEIT